MFAKVIVDIKSKNLYNKYFDYKIPDEWFSFIQRGMRVLVPFGNVQKNKEKIRLGYITDIILQSNKATKSLKKVLDFVPSIDKELFLLVEEILKLPFVSVISVYETVILRELLMYYRQKIFIINKLKVPENILQKFNNKGEWLLTKKDSEEFSIILSKLFAKKIIDIKTVTKQRYSEPKNVFYRLNHLVLGKFHNNLNKNQNQYLDFIISLYEKNNISEISRQKIIQFMSEVKNFIKNPSYVIQLFLNKKILIKIYKNNLKELNIKHHFSFLKDQKVILNKEQLSIFQSFVMNKYNIYLLYGKTGTGKTEIYLKLIEEVIKNKLQVLILVPEIILIAPMLQKIKSKFPDEKIAIIHSLLTSKNRYQYYKMIKNQEVKIVLGTRSAVFAPLKNIGIIIIDEEHDESFQQKEQIVSYDTRELAKIRAKYHKIPLILGSATPSLESYYNATNNKYTLLTLNKRHEGQKFPFIKLIDMKNELKKGNIEPFSEEFKKSLQLTLQRNEQAIILINAKGYAPFLLCRFCSFVPKCLKCNISLTVYKQKKILKCHYCSYTENLKFLCPKCHQKKIKTFGIGIEYIEYYLKKIFPNVSYDIFDANSINSIREYETKWENFNKSKFQILLGTQIISKGLDFKNVTFTGILAFDNMLKIPDFRAYEKTFQLLMQTAGRSGRHKPGTVIIQGYDVKNYVIRSVANYNDQEILDKMLLERKIFSLPPFSYISKILICHKSFNECFYISEFLKNILKNSFNRDEMKILGPNLSLMTKKNNKYRFLLTLKYFHWPLKFDFISLKNNVLFSKADIFFDRFATLF